MNEIEMTPESTKIELSIPNRLIKMTIATLVGGIASLLAESAFDKVVAYRHNSVTKNPDK